MHDCPVLRTGKGLSSAPFPRDRLSSTLSSGEPAEISVALRSRRGGVAVSAAPIPTHFVAAAALDDALAHLRRMGGAAKRGTLSTDPGWRASRGQDCASPPAVG